VTEELKKLIQDKKLPPHPQGTNLDVFAVLVHAMGAASDYGYDPENDYREHYPYLMWPYNSMLHDISFQHMGP
jgi:hypothetical protein